MKLILKITVIAIVALAIFGLAYWLINPQFGGRISKVEKARFKNSPQWNGKEFVNQSTTTMDVNLRTMPGLIKANISGRKERDPKQELPMKLFNKEEWDNQGNAFRFTWFGHSTGLMHLDGKNLMIDPMFGQDASPIGPFRTMRYSKNATEQIELLPEIDAVFISHDHYDHLDYESILKIKDKVKHFYVPLGVKRHLLRWEVAEEKITEMDWWDEIQLDSTQITFVPARHFSGRGPFDRAESLWGGWTFINPQQRIFWSGDGGYDTHFKLIGEKLGPFDLAFVECGQYNKLWHHIHMYPEESVQAAIDVKAKAAMPIHWGAFTLALHQWQDPVKRFQVEAEKHNLTTFMPRLGIMQVLPINSAKPLWWESFN